MFSPLSIAGLQLWLKADAGLWQNIAGTTPASADGDPVKRWDDQSGNARNATQGTTSKAPTLKLALLNGLPVIRSDGIDDVLTLSGLSLGTAHTVLVVFAELAALASGVLIGRDGGNYCPFYDGANGLNYSELNPSQHSASITYGIIAGVFSVGAIRRSGTNVQFYKNGSQVGADQTLGGNDGMLGPTGVFGAGTANAFFAKADIAEVLIYDSALSPADRAAVESYLNGRWAVY